jgi:coenzyme F420-0:L-glutamate ligase/coenzyme F420-1:gamma-L-glutamate ligase
VQPGDSLADLIIAALRADDLMLEDSDVLVIAQKVVSKAEGRLVDLDTVEPSPAAKELAVRCEKDPRLVELVLQESRAVVRAVPGVLIVEDRRGFVCANAGIDRSNVEQGCEGERVALLPLEPDASARAVRERIAEVTGARPAIVINDSHGRAFRQGTVGVAIGAAGIAPLWDRRGERDLTGYTLKATVIGLADEVAAAASLLMGPAADGIPAVVVRGVPFPSGEEGARSLPWPREQDLFREPREAFGWSALPSASPHP